MGVLHNVCEAYMVFAVICLFQPNLSKRQQLLLTVPFGVYTLAELVAVASSPIKDALVVLICMGATLDVATVVCQNKIFCLLTVLLLFICFCIDCMESCSLETQNTSVAFSSCWVSSAIRSIYIFELLLCPLWTISRTYFEYNSCGICFDANRIFLG